MNLIYYSNLVSLDLFNEIYKKSGAFPSQAIQKFHRLLTTGLGKESSLYKISSLPIPNIAKKIDANLFQEKNQLYTSFFTNKYLRQFFNVIFSFLYTFRIYKKNKIQFAIFDYLNQSVTIGGYLACTILRIKKIVIITDLPDHPGFRENVSVYSKILSHLKYRFINSFDGYILLTKQMNDLVNKNNKPNIIIEGFVDADYKVDNADNNNRNIFLYAGGLYEVFGIKKMVDAFCEVDNNQHELHIYGNGDMVDYLKQKSEKYPQLKFLGEVSNQEIVALLPQCKLLINPRPSALELTKYSFPSKLMEYMTSGTSVLTTKLPGIPKEYDDFLFYFENESSIGFQNKFSEMMSLPEILIKEKGISAQKFVLENKNNYAQAHKILNFLSKSFKNEII